MKISPITLFYITYFVFFIKLIHIFFLCITFNGYCLIFFNRMVYKYPIYVSVVKSEIDEMFLMKFLFLVTFFLIFL